MYILQGDLGFIFNPHKEIRPPPPPIFQKTDLSLPNTSPLSRNNLRLFANNPALLRNTRALLAHRNASFEKNWIVRADIKNFIRIFEAKI